MFCDIGNTYYKLNNMYKNPIVNVKDVFFAKLEMLKFEF